jgi:protein phosphatase
MQTSPVFPKTQLSGNVQWNQIFPTVHIDKTNRWHMETLHRLAASDPGFIIATPFLEIDVTDNAALEQASRWWEELTSTGGEGLPAIKCRGREYLRIMYGPEYTAVRRCAILTSEDPAG